MVLQQQISFSRCYCGYILAVLSTCARPFPYHSKHSQIILGVTKKDVICLGGRGWSKNLTKCDKGARGGGGCTKNLSHTPIFSNRLNSSYVSHYVHPLGYNWIIITKFSNNELWLGGEGS